MKRTVIALLLLLIVGIAAGAQYLTVRSQVRTFVQIIEEADEYIENDDILSAQDAVYRLDHRYEEAQKTLDIFLFHSATDDISRQIAMLRRYAQLGNSGDFLAASACAKRALLSLYGSEIPSLSNIL